MKLFLSSVLARIFVADGFLNSLYVLYRLGESIAANNAYRQQETEHASKRIQMQSTVTNVTSVRCSSSCPSSDAFTTSNIQELIQKLHSGLEVSRIYILLLNI